MTQQYSEDIYIRNKNMPSPLLKGLGLVIISRGSLIPVLVAGFGFAASPTETTSKETLWSCGVNSNLQTSECDHLTDAAWLLIDQADWECAEMGWAMLSALGDGLVDRNDNIQYGQAWCTEYEPEDPETCDFSGQIDFGPTAFNSTYAALQLIAHEEFHVYYARKHEGAQPDYINSFATDCANQVVY